MKIVKAVQYLDEIENITAIGEMLFGVYELRINYKDPENPILRIIYDEKESIVLLGDYVCITDSNDLVIVGRYAFDSFGGDTIDR